MIKFIEVEDDEIPATEEGHRGRVSYPILKMFMESGKKAVKLDRTGMQQSTAGLYSCLRSYAQNHKMPVRVYQRNGEMYLVRTDIDKEGKPIPEKTEEEKAAELEAAAIDITPDEVDKRHKEEKHKTTK